MHYIHWRIGEDIKGRFPVRAVVELYTETDATGHVLREIDLDGTGSVLYRGPSSENRFAFFDHQVVEPTEREDDISPEAFEQLWSQTDT